MRGTTKILLLNVAIFFALIAIHEISHFLAGYYFGCKLFSISLFDIAKGSFTELVCPSNDVNWVINLSGVLSTLSIGLVLLPLNTSSRSLFFLVMGFSLIFGALDISSFFRVQSVFYVAVLSGLGLMTFGEYNTALNMTYP